MKDRHSRFRRWGILLAAAAALYCLVGFLILPPIVRGQIEKRAAIALDREVRLESVRINPLVFSVAVGGLRVQDKDGGELVAWKEAFLNADPVGSLFAWEWRIHEVRLVEARHRLGIDQSGDLNIADLVAKFARPSEPASEPAPLPRLRICAVRIVDAQLEWSDRSRRRPFRTLIGPVSFTLNAFSTKPGSGGDYSVVGATDSGETFAFTGHLSAQPLGVKGHMEVTGFSLPKHMPLVEDRLPARVGEGRFSVKGDFEVGFCGAWVARLANVTVGLDDLKILEPSAEETVLAMRKLRVELLTADAMQRTARVSAVAVEGLDVFAVREPGGGINLLRLLPAPTTGVGAQPEEAAGDPGPAPSVKIDRLGVSESRISIVDRTGMRTARLVLDQLGLQAAGLSTDLDQEVGLEMAARWNESGTIGGSGVLRLRPMAVRLDIRGQDISLAPLDPLAEPFVDARLKSGDAWFAGTVEAAIAADGKPSLSWKGDFGLDGLSLCDGEGAAEVLSWKRLGFAGVAFHLEPLSVAVRELSLDQPSASIQRSEGGVINLQKLIKPRSLSEQVSDAAVDTTATTGRLSERLAAASQPKLDFEAKVDAIVISGGRIRFADRSFSPGFATEMREFGGTIRGVSSEALARADVELSGALDGVAPLRIHGQINPLADDQFSDLKVNFDEIALPIFSPYSGRFIGKTIGKGSLSVDIGVRVSQRELSGENKLVFDQFYLGEPVESAEALNLPVGLALALLRDREGRISLDVPVRGNLDDPDFKYGRVIWRTLGNILVKAATSPFALLGSLVPGGGAEDLSELAFASGSAEITEEARKRLDALASALRERPALRLEIVAPLAEEADRAGLAQTALERMLVGEAERFRSESSQPGQLPLEPKREELVERLFLRQFPAEAARIANAEDGKKEGLVRRTWRRLTGGERAENKSVEGPVGLTLVEMQARLLEAVELGDADFRALAEARAGAVRSALIASGWVEAERVAVAAGKEKPEGAVTPSGSGRVYFRLE